MNQLDLVARWNGEFGGDVVVRIDGRDLIDLLREIEAPSASAEGHPELAGAYAGLSREEWLQGSEPRQGRVPILSCECGVTECWPLEVRVTVADDTVTWSEFHQPHRATWVYSSLGPFTFDRQDYERAIGALAGLREA